MAKHTIVVTKDVFNEILSGVTTEVRYQFTRDVHEKDKLKIWRAGDAGNDYNSWGIDATVKSLKRHRHDVWYIRDYSLVVNVQLVLF